MSITLVEKFKLEELESKVLRHFGFLNRTHSEIETAKTAAKKNKKLQKNKKLKKLRLIE